MTAAVFNEIRPAALACIFSETSFTRHFQNSLRNATAITMRAATAYSSHVIRCSNACRAPACYACRWASFRISSTLSATTRRMPAIASSCVGASQDRQRWEFSAQSDVFVVFGGPFRGVGVALCFFIHRLVLIHVASRSCARSTCGAPCERTCQRS